MMIIEPNMDEGSSPVKILREDRRKEVIKDFLVFERRRTRVLCRTTFEGDAEPLLEAEEEEAGDDEEVEGVGEQCLEDTFSVYSTTISNISADMASQYLAVKMN
ncbi:hypothetical protein GCK72_006603 [Caenorhabditis remanei]|uniref:Uncharacterized protein n=1 Tax=Caenorhabditis remanei TaxID=31234 RepID=A0A6A5HGQ6_CAERE|nr:hypothetical protein GCK72_006603 [Caenorhabditis remanei]KAF1766645.1 hypothetical protein GCK72_006603 [Caenorhabditis remanei]